MYMIYKRRGSIEKKKGKRWRDAVVVGTQHDKKNTSVIDLPATDSIAPLVLEAQLPTIHGLSRT
jgi:hypothetical protein